MVLAAPIRRGPWRRRQHTTTVSIVYGSFTPHGTARRNAHAIQHVLSSQLPSSSFIVSEPLDGTSFDFNSLAADASSPEEEQQQQQQKRLLIIATSSMFGQPPDGTYNK